MFCIRHPNGANHEDARSFIVRIPLAGFFQGAALMVPTGSSPVHLNPELIVVLA
jgi:hypothetical protein